MSFIQNLFLSRDNNANGANYVGQQDRIWWNPDTNAFYYSDGNTAGGIIITGAGGNGAPGGPVNSIQINDGNGAFTGTNNLTFNGTVVSITGNVEATYFVGDGSQLTNLPVQTGTYSNSNVQYYLPTYSGNLSPQYLLTDNYLYANGNSIFANTILSGNINLGNLYIDDQTIGGKNINGNITLLPEGDGWVVTPKILIDGMSVANTGGTLEFITPANVDIQFSPGTSGSILTSSNVVPTANNIASLGNITNRYTDLWIGTGNINLIDRTFNQNEQIYADSGNLIFANSNGIKFGEFEIYDTTISTINPNANIIIGKVTSNAYVEINRPLTVNSTGGNGIAFQVERSGQTVVYAPTAIANTEAAMNIIGTSSGNVQPRNFTGTMLQVTGQDDQSTRISFDAFGANGAQNSYVSIAARAARGNVDVPQSLQTNDLMMRITNQGWTGNGVYAPSIARLNFAAAENFTSNAAVGTYANIQLTPIGSNVIKTITGFSGNGINFPNASVGGTGNLGITFQDGSYQNTAYTSTNTVGSATAATGISIAPTNTSATGNIVITNTGVITVAGTSNQVFVGGANVIAPANGAVTLSLPQDIAPSSSPTFNTLPVNDLIILGNVSNVIPAVVSGKIVYVANTATQLSDINTSGLVSGNSANGYYAGILYNTTNNTWDMSIGNSVGISADLVDTANANVEIQLHVGNAVAHLDYPYAVIQGDIDQDSYTQIVLQNHNQGANASADYVAVNNIGNDGNNYIDMGINSNVYSNNDYVVTKANDGYMYVNGGNLVIGTQTPSKVINFFTGGTNSTSYIRGTLNDAGLSMIGNVTANNFIGNTLAAVTVSASGNITGSYLSALNQISVQGNVIAQNVNTGILSASGNIVSGNIRTGNISATGNITASYLITANTIIDSGVSTTGTITAQAITATTISGTGNITGTTINATTRFISPLISVTGNITGGNLLTDGYISTTGNATFGNVQTTGRVTVTGNLDAGNLRTANTVFATTVSATANITASYYFGNGSQLTGLNAYQTVVANGVNLLANSTSGILTLTSDNNFIITSNATTDTVTLAVSNSPSFVGNVTAGNILASGIVSSTGNVIGGNVRTAGIVTATGNITTAGYFVGDGGFISNVTGITGTKIVNGTSYANIAASGGNLVIAVSGNTVETVTSTGANITGYANITGNTTTANLTVTNKTNLNSNANVTITGGIRGQTLITDGAGNLSWTSPTAGNVITLVGNTSANIDFTYNTTTLIYLPTGTITLTLANYTAGHTARVIIRFGSPYRVNMGVANAQQTTEGTTTLPTTGAGGHKIVGNQSIQLLYTCFDNTAGNCYVASTFL
jgi:hypothetical protein